MTIIVVKLSKLHKYKERKYSPIIIEKNSRENLQTSEPKDWKKIVQGQRFRQDNNKKMKTLLPINNNPYVIKTE